MSDLPPPSAAPPEGAPADATAPHPAAVFQRLAGDDTARLRRGLRPIRKLLVANRGEIAIRVFRAANELGIRTVGVHSKEDRLALHRMKCDEAYEIGEGKGPVGAYLSVEEIVDVAVRTGADAVHPGYGFLSENPDFADAVVRAGRIWVGPPPAVMRRVSSKVESRKLARSLGIPVIPGTEGPIPSLDAAIEFGRAHGYPLMVKAARGGGGRGIRAAASEDELRTLLPLAKAEALNAFGSDEVFLERRLVAPKHIEVQILGDAHGGVYHLFERDCSVQRRHQKVVEVAPAPSLTPAERAAVTERAVRFARAAGYRNAGTVEFLRDAASGESYLIEMNARIQVEHTVTEEVTGVDLVKAQLRLAEGHRLGDADSGVPPQEEIRILGAAIQCRITTENPARAFAPDTGRISTYREAMGFGVRLDAGTAFTGAVIGPYYDSLLVKVTTRGRDLREAAARAHRALDEFRIRGVSTNGRFLMAVLSHEEFLAGTCDTGFIERNPQLLEWRPARDRATRLLQFLAETTVNGNPIVPEGARPKGPLPEPRIPREALVPPPGPAPEGTRDLLIREGPSALARMARASDRLLVCDTTFRDAHQSLLATRMRTFDMLGAAELHARRLRGLFSLEMWGGATYDAAMRFLREDPWARLADLRERIPAVCFQMLVRGSSAVGYANYPDSVVRAFMRESALAGIDIFRIFDSLNWLPGMEVAIESALETGKVCEAAICYTGDLFDGARAYDLGYYVTLAKALEKKGVHFLAIKDMAGLLKPYAAAKLVRALREETGLPIRLHTHDTAGIQAATVLAAADAGVSVVDLATASLSGLTSQPNLDSIVAAMADHERRATGLDRDALAHLSRYMEGVRALYRPFDTEMRAGTAEVYEHEMPGGQVTNLFEQARSLGLAPRWEEVRQAYRDVNFLLGDIVKVTPSSKVVGDFALFLVQNGIAAKDVVERGAHLSFPESVVQLMAGEIGFPPKGFDERLRGVILKGRAPLADRAGKLLPRVDLDDVETRLRERWGEGITRRDALSHALFGRVYDEFAEGRARHGDLSRVPTRAFLYGMEADEEITIDLETGKTLIVKLVSVSEPAADGTRKVSFELNGSPRDVMVRDRRVEARKPQRRRADPAKAGELGAPMPGKVVEWKAGVGQRVERGAALALIEAMKMQVQVAAPLAGIVRSVLVPRGEVVEAGDLLAEIEG